VLSLRELSIAGSPLENIGSTATDSGNTRFVSLLRHIDGPGADPTLRLEVSRTVTRDGLQEEITIRNATREHITTSATLALECDFATMDDVKQGRTAHAVAPASTTSGSTTWENGETSAQISVSSGATITVSDKQARITWNIDLPPRSETTVSWSLSAETSATVVTGYAGAAPWNTPTITHPDIRIERYLRQSLTDLEALLMSHKDTSDYFLAAGAPWFFTLFGRDSLIAARLLLPLGTDLAAATLSTLAHFQGTTVDPRTAEQPGKILHEIRAKELDLGENDVHLPPVYYGTIDATPLWIILLHEAWQAGLSEDAVRTLLPALQAAATWLHDYSDADGDGFLEYHDTDGKGLANQGWKDSGDSIQWFDGTLAEGPIALSEVQGYAYQAALAIADLYAAFGAHSDVDWTAWAANLKEKFNNQFWVTNEHGRYLAIALDAEKRPVDSITSNMGHLLGTGLLSAADEEYIANLLVGADMNSGLGLRTLSSTCGGYWPLSYHGGSVWTHDTGMVIQGMLKAGLTDQAQNLASGILTAAESFSYRMPELHSGDTIDDSRRALPYPAACRPQAWSAATAVIIAQAFDALP
jgi:glycogen debranching enzyme